ncbi:MAG: carbohydrate kinase family protein, partial [Nocardioidaceae bacterium]
EYCWTTLEDVEGVDLSHSQRFDDWHSPVTVSLAFDDDRAMVTHAHAPPVPVDDLIGTPPPSRVCFADMATERPGWIDRAISDGSLVFADLGWDPSEEWDVHSLRQRLEGCHAFVPNAAEAMAFTRTDTPGAALEVIRDWTPLAVVTAGSGGSFAADASTGETAWVPGVKVDSLDSTGAGDVFLAALMKGTLDGWALTQRLRFANLCAALSVRDFGGALASPGWADLCDWWNDAETDPRLARDYAFLGESLATVEHRLFGRAVPTLGFHRTSHDHGRHGPDRQ